MTYPRGARNSLAMAAMLIFCLIWAAGCGSSADGNESDGPFQIVVLSDVHVRLQGNPDDPFYYNQRNLDNLEQALHLIETHYATADFVAVTGDLVGCLFSDNPDDYVNGSANPAETFVAMMDGLEMPYHVILGNHDYQIGIDPALGEGIGTDDITRIEAVWEKVLGIPPYYAFIYKGIHFIFLNSNRGPLNAEVCSGCQIERFCTGSFDTEQLDWFEQILTNEEPVILFCHHPLWTDAKNTLWAISKSFLIDPQDPFYDIVEQHKDKIMAIFVGHGHMWRSDTLHGSIQVHETASIGDMLSSGDHLNVVTIDPARLTVSVQRHAE